MKYDKKSLVMKTIDEDQWGFVDYVLSGSVVLMIVASIWLILTFGGN